MENVRIILASASPRRKEIMGQIGFAPEILPAVGKEETSETEPAKVVMALSSLKAENVALRCMVEEIDREDDARRPFLVLGSDTVVSVDGEILGKPRSHEEAAQMIRRIQGRKHEVYTGVKLIYVPFTGAPRRVSFAEKTVVSVYPMTEEEILAYAGSEEPMDKAGAYGIQGSFGAYIKEIRGDYTNVVGLPGGRVYQEIKKLLTQGE